MRTAFEISSGRIAALDTHSDAPAGNPTVLMVPGYTGSKEDFLPLLRPLASAGYRAVAIDQRGQYESEWASEPGGYRVPALASEVVQLAELLSIDTTALHLVGHSFGGLVARAAVLSKPEWFRSLTLMGSGPAAITGARRRTIEQAEPILAEQGIEWLWEHIAEQSQADPKFRDSPPAVRHFLRQRFLANDPTGLQVMGTELREMADHTAQLAAVELPMLVLYGAADDAWLPEVQRDMAQRLGAARAVIDDAAHSPAVENPAATLAALLDFWRRF